MTSPPLAPLFADPARQASASMHGYWAQVWRSVLAWLDLDDQGGLYLEGAEDFDKLRTGQAEAVQVKEVEGLPRFSE